MAEFSFTMANGSTMYWDAPDPEIVVLGLDEDLYCITDHNMIEAIDKMVYTDVDFRK